MSAKIGNEDGASGGWGHRRAAAYETPTRVGIASGGTTSTADGAPAVVVERLSFTYPDGTPALEDIGFVVEQGESVAVIGPNGAGKSTLLLHLNGILRGTGRISVLGLELNDRNLREIRRLVGVVFQDPEDQLFLTNVAQDVAFGPANQGLERGEIGARVDEALTAVGMQGAQERSSHHLSFGQKKRVAVATVLSMRPEILVLDEPTSNLDPRSRRRVVDILQDLKTTKLVVTHDLGLAYELCERAIVLDKGRVTADGPSADILSDAALLAAHDLELPYGFVPPPRKRAAAPFTPF